MRFLFSILSSSLLLLVANFAAGKELKSDPSLLKGKLDNGLTYYVQKNDNPKGRAVFRLFIKSGSVLEDENQRGLAHFIEHMAFNGIEGFPGSSLISFLERNGAKFGRDINAHTSMNETVYKLDLPLRNKEFTDSVLNILSGWAGGLLFDPNEIDQERGVIVSEWYTRSGNDLSTRFLNELLNDSKFSKRLTIGDTAVIKNFKYETIRSFYNDWYRPSLMAVSVVGDIDPEQIVTTLNSKFSKLQNNSKRKYIEHKIDNFKVDSLSILFDKSAQKTDLTIVRFYDKKGGMQNENDYFEYLKRSFYNRLSKQRLASLSIEQRSYSKGNVGLTTFLNTKGVHQVSADIRPDKLIGGISELMIDAENIERYGFTNSEIEKMKKIYLSELKRKASSSNKRESSAITDEIYNDFFNRIPVVEPSYEYQLAQKYIDKIDSVAILSFIKRLDTRNTRAKYIITTNDSLIAKKLSPEKMFDIADSIKKLQLSRYFKAVKMHKSLVDEFESKGKIVEKRLIKEVDAYKYELSNGVTVIYKESALDKGKIQISGFRKGGLYELDSTDYSEGLFAAPAVSSSGAGKFTREELSNYLAGNTASVRFLIDKTRSGIVGGSDLSDITTLFELIRLKWMEPKCDSAMFEILKRKYIEDLKMVKKTKGEIFSEEFGKIIQRGDYTTRELSVEEVNKIDFSRLMSIYEKSFGIADGYCFIILADSNSEEIEEYIEKYLGSLPFGKREISYKYKGAAINLDSARFEKSSGDGQKSTVLIVSQVDKLADPLREFNLKLDLAKSVLRKRLLTQLREKMGKVYSVSVSAGSIAIPANLTRTTISFSCTPQDAQLLIDECAKIIDQMVADPKGFESELSDAKKMLKADNKSERDKNSYWSAFLRSVAYNQDNYWSFATNYDNLVDSITSEDIATIIESYIQKTPKIIGVQNPDNNK